MTWQAFNGDCITLLKRLAPCQFDSVVTDPPYALSFMGREWDSFGDGKGFQAWCEEWSRECLRVLKPGGHLVAFGGTRTYHREACAIEDAGFEIRDSLHWIYGSGFPKGMNVSRAIDVALNADPEVIGREQNWDASRAADGKQAYGDYPGSWDILTPVTDEAKQWQGWNTSLKPGHEPIVLARKRLSEKNVVGNVLEHGTGALNIDACRIATTDHWEATGKQSAAGVSYTGSTDGSLNVSVSTTHEDGRRPPNILLTHSAACEVTGTRTVPTEDRSRPPRTPNTIYGSGNGTNTTTASGSQPDTDHEDVEVWDCAEDCPVAEIGSASRFFPCFRYQAKAARSERPKVDGVTAHPTVKPLALMQWIARLVTRPGGYVLDPFAGTGTTAEACEREGFDCMLIEQDSQYMRLIGKRMEKYP